MEIKGKIERWQVASFGNYSMGNVGFVIVGLYQGKPYRTSFVSKIEDWKVYTENSIYELGNPLNGEWGAYNVLMNKIKEERNNRNEK